MGGGGGGADCSGEVREVGGADLQEKKVVKDVEREQRKNGKGGELSRGGRERKERARGEGLGKKWGDGKRASCVRT